MTWRESSRARLIAWVGLGVLAIVVGVLVLFALNAGSTESEASPSAERTPPPIAVEPEPAEPEEPPAPDVVPSTALVTLIDDEVVWRTSGGECVVGQSGVAPTIERAVEPGVWEAVTPPNFAIREVAFLSVINASAAEALVLLGDDCTPQVIRTFTGGQFWEPYDDSIRGAISVSPDRTVVLTPGGSVPAPCEPPLRTLSGQAGDLTAMVCQGALAWWDGSAWALSEQPGVVSAAVSADDGTVVSASVQQPECEGTLLRRWTGADALVAEACVPLAGVAAVSASPTTVWAWHESGFEAVALP